MNWILLASGLLVWAGTADEIAQSETASSKSKTVICFWRRLALARFVALDEPSDAFLLPAAGARAILEHLSTYSGLTGSYSLCAWDRAGLKY